MFGLSNYISAYIAYNLGWNLSMNLDFQVLDTSLSEEEEFGEERMEATIEKEERLLNEEGEEVEEYETSFEKLIEIGEDIGKIVDFTVIKIKEEEEVNIIYNTEEATVDEYDTGDHERHNKESVDKFKDNIMDEADKETQDEYEDKTLGDTDKEDIDEFDHGNMDKEEEKKADEFEKEMLQEFDNKLKANSSEKEDKFPMFEF